MLDKSGPELRRSPFAASTAIRKTRAPEGLQHAHLTVALVSKVDSTCDERCSEEAANNGPVVALVGDGQVSTYEEAIGESGPWHPSGLRRFTQADRCARFARRLQVQEWDSLKSCVGLKYEGGKSGRRSGRSTSYYLLCLTSHDCAGG